MEEEQMMAMSKAAEQCFNDMTRDPYPNATGHITCPLSLFFSLSISVLQERARGMRCPALVDLVDVLGGVVVVTVLGTRRIMQSCFFPLTDRVQLMTPSPGRKSHSLAASNRRASNRHHPKQTIVFSTVSVARVVNIFIVERWPRVKLGNSVIDGGDQ